MTPPELTVTPLSPLATGSLFYRIGGMLWATIVVKATFQLVHGEVARPVLPEDLVREDRFGPDHRALEQSRETAPHVPRAGVLLSGHAFAPGGRAVPSVAVRLGISRDRPLIDKTLHVFGDRTLAAPRIVAPFHTMSLTYERAYGGPAIADNPAGIGGPGSAALPNIVCPKEPHKAAGFGPIAPSWEARRQYLGALQPAALSSPSLEVPPDFDWRFFQPAPLDQQLNQLHGDEWIVLDGMCSALARVHSRLPHVTAAARRVGSGQPVDLRADLLVIDADRLLASLIWRGRFQVDPGQAARGLRFHAGLEQPGRPVQWPTEGPTTTAHPRGLAGGQGASPSALTTETTELDVRALFGVLDPFSRGPESPLARPATTEKAAALPTGTAEVDLRSLRRTAVPFEDATAAEVRERSRADVCATMDGIAALSPSLPFVGANPSRPPAASIPAPVSPGEPPRHTGTAEIHPQSLLAVESPPIVVPEPPLLRIAEPSPATAPLSRATSAPPPIDNAMLLLSRREVEAILAAGGRLDGSNLVGANLSGLDLSGRSLLRSNLSCAKLRGANLTGANLAHATLEGADLRGALLEGADLSSAKLASANLDGARLGRCNGSLADFQEASLVDADVGGGRFRGAIFTGAKMRRVRAERADFTEAHLEGVDLSLARLVGAALASADLSEANLERADLQWANLRGANVRGAVRTMARFTGADMTGVSGAV